MNNAENCRLEKIYLYSRFERFWHWAQTVIVIMLAVTGFEISGSYHLFGFEEAVEIHSFLGITWLILYAFIIFWQATTGEWKHYIPTTKMLFEVARYYMIGIFKGEEHPVPKSERVKHNPLQRLTYLSIAVILIPVQMATGLLYWTYNMWPQLAITASWTDLAPVALIHLAGAFGFLVFVIVHVYMTTTGHSLTAHFKAMCTGFEEVEVKE